jgi:hypothetical protein
MMDQFNFLLKELYEKYNFVKQANNNELVIEYSNLIQKFNTYKMENTNDTELYTQRNNKDDNLYLLINEYNLLQDKYNQIYYKQEKSDEKEQQIYDEDFLPSLTNNTIQIISIIDKSTDAIIVKIIYNKEYYVLKVFKNKENFNIEYNIHRYLQNNDFKNKCQNILVNYNFCKNSDYNIIDSYNLLKNFYTEYFILMDYYDGDLFSLVENLEHIEHCYIIKKVLFDTIKSLYFNNFYYLDFKLENFLYKITDNNIEIKLCDLGGFFWDINCNISYSYTYTNIKNVMYNKLQKKQFKTNKNFYTKLDLKKMMIHSFCMSIISLYSSDNNILKSKNEYDEKIKYAINMYENDIYYDNHSDYNQLSFKYKLYLNYLNDIINTFFKNIFYSNIQLINTVNLIKNSYSYINEYELDNYFLNFIY